jgi:hypothetical protein
MLLRIAGALSLAMAGGFMFAFHRYYWSLRGCFDAQGLCFDPDSGQAVSSLNWTWSLGALAFTVMGLMLMLWRPPRDRLQG